VTDNVARMLLKTSSVQWGINMEQRGMNMEQTEQSPSQFVEIRIGPLAQFAIKTVIVSAAIVVSAWILLGILDDFATRRMEQLEATVRTATALGGRRFWTKLESQLDNLADPKTDISPEKKQKILAQIKTISDRWRPFLVEAASTISAEPNPPPR
jgi:hypothetical protein